MFRARQPQVIHKGDPVQMVNSMVFPFRCGVEISEKDCFCNGAEVRCGSPSEFSAFSLCGSFLSHLCKAPVGLIPKLISLVQV